MPRSSVAPGVVDVEGVEVAGRAVTAELARDDALDAGRGQKLRDLLAMLVAQLLLRAVGAQALHRAADVEAGLVERVAERVAGIAQHHPPAGLRHERAPVTHRAADADDGALERAAHGGRRD